MIKAFSVHTVPIGLFLSPAQMQIFVAGRGMLGYSAYPPEARLHQPGGGILVKDQGFDLLETEADAIRLTSYCRGNLPMFEWDFDARHFDADRINWRRQADMAV